MIQSSTLLAIARVCHEANRAYCQTLGDTSQVPWDEAPLWQRDSAYAGVKFRLENPLATPAEMHDSWSRQKLADAWVYGPVKDAERKTHPCLVPYENLPKEQQIKDYLFSGIVQAMSR